MSPAAPPASAPMPAPFPPPAKAPIAVPAPADPATISTSCASNECDAAAPDWGRSAVGAVVCQRRDAWARVLPMLRRICRVWLRSVVERRLQPSRLLVLLLARES